MRPQIGAALAAALLAFMPCAGAAGARAGAVRAAPGPARAASSTCPGADLRPTSANIATIDAATLCLVDRVRIAHGLRALKANRELRAVAKSQVQDMVRLNYFAHDRPSGQTPATLIAATRYGRHARSLSIGENIGWGTGVYATPAQMVAAWLQSPPHREIIFTSEFSDAGVGATPAVPSNLAEGQVGATYALELARQ
jgi:uncharacterized protein YkwD